jgi:hypothetical protein
MLSLAEYDIICSHLFSFFLVWGATVIMCIFVGMDKAKPALRRSGYLFAKKRAVHFHHS